MEVLKTFLGHLAQVVVIALALAVILGLAIWHVVAGVVALLVFLAAGFTIADCY